MRPYDNPPMESYLIHHGILGQKWGVRRYQNLDGSLTAAGKNRYNSNDTKNQNGFSKGFNTYVNNSKQQDKELKKAQKKYDKDLRKNYVTIYNKAADYANKVIIPDINQRYSDEDLKDPVIFEQYYNEYNKLFGEALTNEAIKMLGERPE